MRDAVLLVAILAATYGAFALLALSQTKHWKRVVGTVGCPSVPIYRAGGIGLVALAYALAVLRDGAGFGSLVWFTAITVGAMAVSFTIAWRPLWLGILFRPGRT